MAKLTKIKDKRLKNPAQYRLRYTVYFPRAIHTVVAVEPDGQKCHVVTVYPADPELWSDDFRTRRT